MTKLQPPDRSALKRPNDGATEETEEQRGDDPQIDTDSADFVAIQKTRVWLFNLRHLRNLWIISLLLDQSSARLCLENLLPVISQKRRVGLR